MKKYIEKIKLKSEKERKKIAGIFAGVITFIIVLVWIVLMILFSPKEKNNFSKDKQFENLFNKFEKKISEIRNISLEKNIDRKTISNREV